MHVLTQGRQLGMAGVCSCHTLGPGGEIKVTFKYKSMNVSLSICAGYYVVKLLTYLILFVLGGT